MELENISDNSPERLEDSSAEIINVQNSPKTFFLSAIGKTKEKIMPSRETKAKTPQGRHIKNQKKEGTNSLTQTNKTAGRAEGTNTSKIILPKNKCIVGKMTAMEIALITTITTFSIIAGLVFCLFVGLMLESIPMILVGGIPLALMILTGISAECVH